MIYQCCNETRRATLLSNTAIVLNGIDFLEVASAASLPPGSSPVLLVHCLKALPATLAPGNVMILGGESITDVAVISVSLGADPTMLIVQTDRAGDFSAYTLRLVNSVAEAAENPFDVTDVLAGFDPQLAEVGFSFKVECATGFDCLAPVPALAPSPPAPRIDYLAKDYGSFRTLLLDRLSQLLPAWSDSGEADLGVVLAELIAYRGDLLSYQQDAIATEAYLETARSRISLRRHALLVDYHVHDGCNARAWVQLQVAGSSGQGVFLDRKLTRFYTAAPGMPSSLALRAGNEEAALRAGVQVFEPMQNAVLYPEHNRLSFYTWGEAGCCLPRGTIEATLHGSYPHLQPGDVLIFAEVLGAETGDPADANLSHRCAVRLTQVATRDAYGKPLVDPLFEDGTGKPLVDPGSQQATPITEIQWSAEDALPFPVCLSSTTPDASGRQVLTPNVSVVFGNVVLADHGLTLHDIPLGVVPEPRLFYPAASASDRCAPAVRSPLPVRFRPALADSPLTQSVPLPLAGSPVTASIVPLGGTGAISLTDRNGFVCLIIQPGDPTAWPQFFGVQVRANAATPGNLDLQVLYNPSGGATGMNGPVVLEALSNLSLKPADAKFIGTQINALSRFVQVPSTYIPPATPPTALPATITMLTNSGAVTLMDGSSPPVPFLTLLANDPAEWLQSFGVVAQGNQTDPTIFNLSLLYNPPGGTVGLPAPVTVERFLNLSLPGVASEFQSLSELISARSFAQAPNPRLSAAALMDFDPAGAVPAIALTGTFDDQASTWHAVQDLLGSDEDDRAFVVEMEADGTASLRFATPGAPGSANQGTNGLVPDSGTSFVASYRIGNGTAGNVGADSLLFLAAGDSRILSCTNPLPAGGGSDPESNEQIRRRAPQAFLAPERAVTLRDYEALAEASSLVDQAVASLRWTGSWYTVFLAVEPKGGGVLSSQQRQSLTTTVEAARLAGQDLQLESPQYVSLSITLQVTVAPFSFQSDVKQALLQVLGNRLLPDGRKGLFYPDNFTFGQTVYLSRVYSAARTVAGVLSVTATAFGRQGSGSKRSLTTGEIKLGSLQIARLENDPSYPDHGQLTLMMQGGKP